MSAAESEGIWTYPGWRRDDHSTLFILDRNDRNIYDYPKPEHMPDFDTLSCQKKLKYASVFDDRTKFVELINSNNYLKDKDSVDCLWVGLFVCDSVNCVSAILDGETKGVLDLPLILDICGEPPITPLGLAARLCSHKIASLFLSRGVGDPNHREVNGKLPLHEAVDAGFFAHPWSPCDSLFVLLRILNFPDQRDRLETVRILLLHTDVDIQQEFVKYAREGNLNQAITLLTVARDKVIMDGYEKVVNILLEETASLAVHDARSTWLYQSNDWTENRLKFHALLALLELFGHIGDEFLALLRRDVKWESLDEEIEEIINIAGFSENYLDNYLAEHSYRSMSDLLGNKMSPVHGLPMEYVNVYERPFEGALGMFWWMIKDAVSKNIGGDVVKEELVDVTRADKAVFSLGSISKGEKSTYIRFSNPFKLLKSMQQIDASVLLEGMPGLSSQLNQPLENGLFPLHLAANSLSSGLTRLFLRLGACPELQCNNDQSNYRDLYPLDLALSALSHHHYVSDWSPTKSMFKLVYIFCLPELMEPLKTVELLASDASVTRMVAQRCLQEGKLVELAALLMVSWDKLVKPHTERNRDDFSISHCVVSMLCEVLRSELQLFNSPNSQQHQDLKLKKGTLLFAAVMLKIFERARPAIENYRLSLLMEDVPNHMVPSIISNMLKDLGFSLQSEDVNVDDINCLQPEKKPASNNLLTGALMPWGKDKKPDFAWSGGGIHIRPDWHVLRQQSLPTRSYSAGNLKEAGGGATLECFGCMKENTPRPPAVPVPVWSLRGLGLFSLASKRWIRLR